MALLWALQRRRVFEMFRIRRNHVGEGRGILIESIRLHVPDSVIMVLIAVGRYGTLVLIS